MFDKVTLLFEILKTAALLYEVNWHGPNHIGTLLERFNTACGRDFRADPGTTGADVIEEWPDSAAEMARTYLEFVYAKGTEPEWILKAEAANQVVKP